jgi:hypothetical protein
MFGEVAKKISGNEGFSCAALVGEEVWCGKRNGTVCVFNRKVQRLIL